MKTLRQYKERTLIGHVDDEPIYLSAPSWACGWYWGFGYLGNKHCHYHFDGLNQKVNMHDAILEHFGDSLQIRASKLWTFAELMQTFYSLRKTAELLGRGGSHLSANPCKDVIVNTEEAERINDKVLPAVFDEIYNILDECANDQKLFAQLVDLNLKGDTQKVVDFMNGNDIKTDDLKGIEGITSHDFHIIHSMYWKQYHANK